ncbi:MAG: hypothetical protein FIA98_15295, partial [Anaerolineae bacterium]|nr:hypothetical protein [Anaerolineae bacterium]
MKALKPSCALIACLLVIILSSCSSAPETPVIMPSESSALPQASQPSASQAQESPATSSPVATTTQDAPQPAASEIPDPLNRLLDLRGISFSQSGARPDGSTQSIRGEIDATGNMHLTYTQTPVTV